MVALVLIALLSFYFLRLIYKDITLAVYSFIPYNYLFDLLFFLTESGFGAVSTALRTIVVAIFFVKVGGVRFFSIKKPGYIFVLLLMIILLISSLLGSSVSKSFGESVKFMLIVGSFFIYLAYFTRNELKPLYFKRMVFQVLLITIANIALSNIFSFGWGGYSDDVGFYTGGIISNMWYVPAFAVLATIGAANLNKGNNTWLYIAAVIVLLILMVALRRSAYIIIVITALMALVFFKIQVRLVRIAFGILILLAACAPFFVPYLQKQIEARSKTFDKGVEQESRLKETEVLWDERLTESPMMVLLFGERPFDSAEHYGKGSFGDRPLHVDMNIIFFSSGLVGLVLYSLFYLALIFRYFSLVRKAPKIKVVRAYKYLFFAAFSSMVALSFSGGLNAITYRMFGFFVIALSLGQLKFMIIQHKKEQQKALETEI